MISGFPLYRLIFPDTDTVRPSYCWGLENCAALDEGIRVQSLTGFFRLQDASYKATGHKAQKVRVTGYLMWDDEHNGNADVGSSIQWISNNGFHHPWRSTAWEIHPVMKIEVVE